MVGIATRQILIISSAEFLKQERVSQPSIVQNKIMKTISELNSKAWYRLLKVFFILAFLTILISANALFVFSRGFKNINQDKTLIQCTYGNKNVFTPQSIDIQLNNSDFINEVFDYKIFFENYNDYLIRNIFEGCYHRTSGDIFAIQKVYEVWGDERLKDTAKTMTESEKKYLDDVLPKIESAITNSQKSNYLNYSVKLFDIKPVFSYGDFITSFLITNLIIIAGFEIIRRAFYYIILGSIRPPK